MPTAWRRSFEGGEAILLTDDGRFPNNSSLPLLVYTQAFDPHSVSPEEVERVFGSHRWPAAWRDGVYTDHHYHSTAHEGLGTYAGSATLRFGGPEGIEIDAVAGDVIVIPAGVAHVTLRSSTDFMLVGAYPEGQKPDLLWGRPGERPAAEDRILEVGLPVLDPVRGADGPLLDTWRAPES